MNHRILFISIIIIFLGSHPIAGQEKCDHNKIIMSFLKKISTPHYKSSLYDYQTFFEQESETELILRGNYIDKYPFTSLDYITDTVSLTINQLLNNKTYRDLIAFKNKHSTNWYVTFSHKEGTATLIYKVGIQNAEQYFYFQMVNWPDNEQCQIVDIRDSIGNSIIRSTSLY